MIRFLTERQDTLRKALPHFDVSKILGANIDTFHKNPSHQRNLLGSLKGTHRTQIEVGGRTFALTANPIVEGLANGLLVAQLKAMAISVVWPVIATAVIAFIVKATIGLRPTEENEELGLDLSDHGEEGYHG